MLETKLPAKEIDLDLLVFVERYVTNLLKWDLLTFFGNHPHEKKSALCRRRADED